MNLDKIIICFILLLAIALTIYCPCQPVLMCHEVTFYLTLFLAIGYVYYINHMKQLNN